MVLSAAARLSIADPSWAPRPGQARHQGVEVPDQLTQLGVVDPDGVEKARQAGEECVDHLLAVGEVVGQRRRLRHDVRDGSRLALEHVDDRPGQLVHLVGRECARTEAGSRRTPRSDRWPGWSATRGMTPSGRQRPAAGSCRGEWQEIAGPGGSRSGWRPSVVVVRCCELSTLNETSAWFCCRVTAADLPDLDAGDTDGVAGLQLRRVGELRHVPGRGLRVHVEQRRDDDRGDERRRRRRRRRPSRPCAASPGMVMARSHDRVTRPSRTGDSSSVETAGEDGDEPLTAATICEIARVCGGSATTGARAPPSRSSHWRRRTGAVVGGDGAGEE